MKKLTINSIFILFLYFTSFSQGLINNSANLYLTSNSNLILSGNANWIQNGTVTCVSGSNVKFTGNAYQYIQGSNTTNFSNVLINNSGGGVVAGRNFSILGTLTLTSGHFDLKNYTIDLGTTGTVSGENENARIRATSGITGGGTEGGNTGIIRATRDNPSGNVAGLGLNFNPSVALGNNTIIERGCNPLQGTGSYLSNYSIFRWYRIIPGSGTVSSITVNNFYYWGGTGNAELNGHIEANLQMFQRVQYWNGTTNPIYWEPRPSTPNTGSDFVASSTTTNPIMLNYILVTLGSTTTPLPVEYLAFKATCQLSINSITWQTASESNNYGFVVQKSHDASEWEYLGFVVGQGNSNTTTTYQFTDYNPYYPITYYRLLQIDNDGITTPSNVVSANCSNASPVAEDIIPLLSNGMLNILVQGNPEVNYRVYITNVLGQVIYQQKVNLTESLQRFSIEQPFATGMYYINMVGNNVYVSKPFVIHR